MTKKGVLFEFFLVIGMFILVNLVSENTQPLISLHDHQGNDGVYYFEAAEQLANHLPLQTKGPYVYRIGTPWLVSLLFPKDILIGFKIVNIIGNFLSTLLLTLFLRQYITNVKIRLLMISVFLLNWLGPVRFNYFYPVLTDPWLFVFLLAGLVLIKSMQPHPSVLAITLMAVFTSIAVFFREATLVIAIGFVFVTNPIPRINYLLLLFSNANIKEFLKKLVPVYFIPLLFGSLSVYLITRVVVKTNFYSFFDYAVYWALEKPLWTYILGWFITFGPIIILLIFQWRYVVRFLGKNQSLFIALLVISIFGWIGGNDTERILFWGAPIVYLLAGKVIETFYMQVLTSPITYFLTVVQAISMRVFWVTPDVPGGPTSVLPIFTLPSNHVNYHDLYSFNGSWNIEIITLGEYLLLTAILLIWLNLRERQKKADIL